MVNKYFSNDPMELTHVMRIYEEEIHNRKEWINESVLRLNEALKNNRGASIIIHYAMSIITHAMVVVRILDEDAVSSRKSDKERSKERARILHERNPGLPEPPNMLRSIRNNYEHYEEKIDQWATTSTKMNYVDLVVAGEGIMAVSGVDYQDTFRQLEGNKLTFWNKKVDLQEVINWVGNISKTITKNNRQRF